MNFRLYFLIGVIFILFGSSCKVPTVYEEVGPQKIQLGDDIKWAGKDFDDSGWGRNEDVEQQGLFWVRRVTKIPDLKEPLSNQTILIGASGVYQAYWDGHYIGENGVLKSSNQPEIPGSYLTYFLLPDSLLLAGEHVLALRMTLDAPYISQHAYFTIGNYFELLRGPLQLSKYMFMIAGAFLITAIYFFFVFVNQRKEYSSLIFGFVCLAFCALLLMEFVKLYYLYPYPFQYVRLEVIGILHLLISLLVPWYFAIQFSFPRKKILLGVLLAITFFLQVKLHSAFDFVAVLHNMVMWGFSFLVVAFAVFKKKSGAVFVGISLIICFLILGFTPYFNTAYVKSYDITVFVCFIILVLSMLYLLTLKRKEEKLAYEESLVVSERLKNELLKKNIRPHFIMNTLTSLMDWVEESPQEGVKFIQSLADEFEVLNQIADYQQVPIGQEIKLCRSHIKVMGYRKEITYVWEEQGIDPNDIIPPAIIHTIIENGVTHSEADENGKVTFRLVFEKNNQWRQYQLFTIAKNRKSKGSSSSSKKGGTGFKYIKARLEESYPDKWEMTSQENEEGWETTIKIYS